MFCPKCGKQLSDETAFCTGCGATLQTAEPATNAAEPEQPKEVIAEETVEVKQVAEPEQAASQFAQVQFDAPKKKSKSKKLAIAIGAAAVVVVVALAIILNLTMIEGFFVKNFGSDSDYLAFVEKNALNSYTDDLTESYGSLMQSKKPENSMKTQVKLNISDELLSLLGTYIKESGGQEMDLAWLKTIAMNFDINQKGDLMQLIAALEIDGQDIIGAEMISDMAKQEMFVALVGLTEQYLKLDVGAMTDDMVGNDLGSIGGMASAGASNQLLEIVSDPEFKKLLPTDKELNNLLDKYLQIVLDNMNSVAKEKDTIEINGIEQKVTVLEIEIDSDTLVAIAEEVLKEAKSDKELKKHITNIAKYLEKKNLVEDAGEAYDAFKEAVEEGLTSLDDMDYKNETLAVIVDYINGNHEVIGRKIEIDDEDILYYAIVRKGDEFAVTVEMPKVVFSGGGTEKKNVVNGEFVLEVDDTKYLKIVATSLSFDETLYGALNGNIRITPTDELLDLMDLPDTSAALISMSDLAIELDFTGDKQSAKVDMNLMNGNKMFVGISFSSESQKAVDIKRPSSSKVIESSNVDKWMKSIDFSKVVAALEKTSVPKDLVDMLSQLVK